MAPVDPEVLISNVKPLSLIGAQLGGVVALIATITRFYFTAHRNLPPAQHTRSRHALEHDSLSTFLALGSLCTLVSVFAKINWLAASFYEWLHQTPSYPNLYPKLVNMGLPSYRHLTDGTLPLGLWWQDASVLNQYFYGILANPTNFFFAFQNFAGLAVFSLFVGIEGQHTRLYLNYNTQRRVANAPRSPSQYSHWPSPFIHHAWPSRRPKCSHELLLRRALPGSHPIGLKYSPPVFSGHRFLACAYRLVHGLSCLGAGFFG